MLSVICLLRKETEQAVQRANTLEAVASDGIYSIICHLISVICLAGRRQTGLY
jgi:hypothetical protein